MATGNSAVLVTYTGGSLRRRVITKADAKKMLHVELEEDLVWEPGNRHTVELESAPEELLEFFKNDPGFKVKEKDTTPARTPGSSSTGQQSSGRNS